ncbi:AraC family transcriptional regulator [Flavobacterium sp. MAH-1]|uniref:AraC family transcriptional regulator n=1 Tax=Flavobacterium agri TaxID=2743471 RepID=A0A7Y9C626_9FLAO|nr:helix-turn-helix domain-containing protein [Flavobacterium agri]NUY81887.1 AraC family transcriptional regulator [Flavobacterium agri]NYA71911.1 AraC family transcriptional regulator [Flavobacterium agri]
MLVKPVLLYCFTALSAAAHSQKPAVPDSLSDKPYLYFREKLDAENLDKSGQRLYANAYLALAKSRKDWVETMEAYKSLLYVSEDKQRPVYADSMVYAARKTKRNDLIGSAYLTKGITFYKLKKHKAALDNYIIADSYISRTDDQYLIHKLKFSLAETHYYLRHYEDAVRLFKICVSYYEKTGGKPWLSSLHHLGLCYTRLDKYDLCTAINELGLRESIKWGQDDMVVYFNHSEGINQYYRKNYELALVKLKQSIPSLVRMQDMHNEIVAYFYIAKSFSDSGHFDKALPFLLKIDDALTQHHYIRHDLRDGIGMLIDHYASIGNKELELRYSYHLRKADSILSTDFEILSNKVHAHTDAANDSRIRRLEKEKVQDKHLLFWSVGIVACTGLAFGGLLYHRNRELKKQFRKRYAEFLQNGQKPVEKTTKRVKYNEVEMTPEKEAELCQALLEFEKRELYLKENLTQTVVAKLLKTNTKYLLYIIKKHRNKNFVSYINDLKCEHVYRLLTDHPKYRHFDQQSLAETVGFGTAQNLRRVFTKRYGFSTPFYIEQLEHPTDEGEASV